MKNIDIANGLVFKELEISKDNFDERLIAQKKIYLLQELGTDLGYKYNWYVRGPYSPTLTTYIYTNLDVLSSTDFTQYSLADEAEKNINMVNVLINEKNNEFDTVSWYELLASLLYIYKNRESWGIQKNEEEIFSRLISYKPQYNNGQCEYAWEILKKYKIVQ